MNPTLGKTTPPEQEKEMIEFLGKNLDAYTMASLWYSLFRTDQRPAISKITVPFLYIMPETPLYSMVNVNFLKENVKNSFELVNDISGTTHSILAEKPKECADKIKPFIEKQ